MKRIFFVLLLASLFLPFFSVHAADTGLIPEFNPICWEKDACVAIRKQFSPDATKQVLESGWLQGEAPCNKTGWGKCLPAGVTETQIKFGGQTTFKDIGEFIFVNYNYIISVVGILAAIMIIIAGVQWVTSAGSSEAIGSAKKRIGGALIGMLIAYLSYVILNTINPALVNLRLPQTFMVRSQKIIPEFCRQAPPSSVFAVASEAGKEPDKNSFDKAVFDLPYNKEKLTCGKKYFIKDAGSGTCAGSYCGINKICSPYAFENNNIVNKYGCRDGQIIVHYKPYLIWEKFKQGILFAANLEGDNWLDANTAMFWGVCKNSVNGSYRIGENEWWDDDSTGKSSWSPSEEQVEIHKIKNDKDFSEYYVIYGGLDTAHNGLSHWGCDGENESLAGFLLHTEVGENWDTDDVYLFVGMNASGGSVAGSWGQSVKYENFIPLEDVLNGGVSISVDLYDDDIVEIMKYAKNNPDNTSIPKNGSDK